MDAAALLKSQGWRGKGHSLHPTDNAIGLSKPLLLSRNSDQKGLGQKPHYTNDQWWLNAFDQKLKGLDTSDGAVVQTVTRGHLTEMRSGTSKYSSAVSSLYASFIRGGMLAGTLTPESESTDATPVAEDGQDSDRQAERVETKAERKARRAARWLRKEQRAARRAAKAAAKEKQARSLKAQQTKDRATRKAEHRAKKEARRQQKEEKAQRKPTGG